MLNKIIINIKKFLCSGLLCAGIALDSNGVMIHKNNLDIHIRMAANHYLSSQGFNSSSIPERLRPDFNQKLDTAKQSMLNQLTYQRQSFIDSTDIEQVVRQTLRPFIDNLTSVIKNYQLDHTVTEAINAYLGTYRLSTYTMADHNLTEFNNRSSNIKTNLRSLMSADRRDYVRKYEVEKVVDDELKVFVRRLTQHPATATITSLNSSFDWFNFFFNSASLPTTIVQQATAPIDTNKIMRDDLDEKVTEIAYLVLNANNIGDYDIPEGLTTEFSQKVQHVIATLKNKMSRTGNNFVWKDDIEVLMLTELQSVIDKINFKGTPCSICLENYQSGERVGILSCGHNYHKDCIYKWFEYQKSCPECKSTNVIVAKIENVR